MAEDLSAPDAERDADLLDPRGFLCHYTRAETAFSHILPSGRLRMNPYMLMRDPFESRHPHFWVPKGIHNETDHNLYVEVSNELGFRRGRYRLLSLTRGDERTSTTRELPFRCPWGRPRMWEQYAENHAGVCLVFDRVALLDTIREGLGGHYWDGDVDYTTASFSLSKGAELDLDVFRDDVKERSSRHIDQYHRDLFFLKTDDWASEYEYRVVYRGDTDTAEWTPPPHDVGYGDSLRYVLLNVERFSRLAPGRSRARDRTRRREVSNDDLGRRTPSAWGPRRLVQGMNLAPTGSRTGHGRRCSSEANGALPASGRAAPRCDAPASGVGYPRGAESRGRGVRGGVLHVRRGARTRPRAHRRGECAMHPAMRITNRRGEVIGNVEEWGRLAAPASYKHWKPDRSAYELASAWSVGEGLAATQRVLSRCPALAGVEPQAAIAEAQTRFDAFSGPRNHDLLIRAGEVIVSVEAKADETFGETIGEYRAAADARRERGEGTKAPERLEGLLAALVPPGASAPDSLRYQLFSATAGALAEAQGARAAVVVIHEFVTPATSPAKRKVNTADLRAFLMELFGAKPPRATEWCIGPFRVPGSDRIPGDVDLYFAKVVTTSFQRWTRKWLELATYQGREVPDVDERIERIATLWSEPVPGDWRRGADERILDPAQRYCRTHSGDPRGEHRIEYEVLAATEPTTVLGSSLIDGVNAVPLARDEAGGRAGNVEADMLLLIGDGGEQRQLLVEVKVDADHAWYAVVENLRQLRLFEESEAAQAVFRERRSATGPLPVEGLVLGPEDFFAHSGRKQAAVGPAQRIIERMANVIRVRLATWDAAKRLVSEVPS